MLATDVDYVLDTSKKQARYSIEIDEKKMHPDWSASFFVEFYIYK